MLTARDEDTMTVAAGGADHGEFHITEGSVAAPAGGADHGEFNITEGSMAAPAGGVDHGEFIVAEEDAAPWGLGEAGWRLGGQTQFGRGIGPRNSLK